MRAAMLAWIACKGVVGGEVAVYHVVVAVVFDDDNVVG